MHARKHLLRASHCSEYFSTHPVGFIIPILQMRQRRHRKVMRFAQGHRASKLCAPQLALCCCLAIPPLPSPCPPQTAAPSSTAPHHPVPVLATSAQLPKPHSLHSCPCLHSSGSSSPLPGGLVLEGSQTFQHLPLCFLLPCAVKHTEASWIWNTLEAPARLFSSSSGTVVF